LAVSKWLMRHFERPMTLVVRLELGRALGHVVEVEDGAASAVVRWSGPDWKGSPWMTPTVIGAVSLFASMARRVSMEAWIVACKHEYQML
jgi:hypothetical protein